LLVDDETTVRLTALSSVGCDDVAMVEPIVAALGHTATAAAAGRALGRLGAAVAPALDAVLAAGSTPTPIALRLVRACGALDDERARAVLRNRLDDPDRVVGLAALDALRGATVDQPLEADLDRVLHDGATHAARALAAISTLGVQDHDSLGRALADEVDLARRRVIAVLAVRHGAEASNAVQALGSPDRGRRALALESLEVTMTRDEVLLGLPLVRPDLDPANRLAALLRVIDAPTRDRRAWLDDLVTDTDDCWRSPWLRACATEARSPSPA
jgi:HEAT repeat protein